MKRAPNHAGEVLLEFHQVGDYVRVSAIDTVTNVEVTVVGSPKVTQDDLTRLAVRKLNYVLDRKRRDKKAGDDNGSPGGGILA